MGGILNGTIAVQSWHGKLNLMRKYRYHLKLCTSKSKEPVTHVAYFKSRDLFELMLHKWSKRGWNYFETTEDRKVNEKEPKVIKYDEGSSLDAVLNCSNPNKTYAYWYDSASHSVSYIKNMKLRELV
jgi:hypothetical protein